MLFLVSADHTPQAITAIRQNPTQTRREALTNLCEAAGGKVVAMYGTLTSGFGAMAIMDADETSGPAIASLIASSGAVQNVQVKRLFTMEEVSKFRARAKELQGSYKAPGPTRGGIWPPYLTARYSAISDISISLTTALQREMVDRISTLLSERSSNGEAATSAC